MVEPGVSRGLNVGSYWQRLCRLIRHRRRYPKALSTDRYREALRFGVSAGTLRELDSLATAYGIIVTLTGLPVALIAAGLFAKIPASGVDSTVIPVWVTVLTLISAAVLFPLYIRLRVSDTGMTYRAAARIVQTMNALDAPGPVRGPDAGLSRRARRRSLRQEVLQLRKIRDDLERLSWALSGDIAVLAGDRVSQRQQEAHSRLGRLCNWVAESPYDECRRRALLFACGMYAQKLISGSTVEALSIDIEDGSIMPTRKKGRVAKGISDLLLTPAFLGGLALGLISIGIQYVLKKYAGG